MRIASTLMFLALMPFVASWAAVLAFYFAVMGASELIAEVWK